ncbi:MarR family winged helix-turn-helix transcriptional regulator [Priestia endophytica]|uniref:MarR family winged helix-turn-helix transcriptional regulator n=1 Tax=Priestia endophytica TaxID=135735 RepID=UPI002282115D|nr:MarR family transcriptional regulator [Priestia endophytica]MCY8235526.1 MarR family transcriptional regulator [Priestia endophytica]
MRQSQDNHIGYLIQQISHLVIQLHNEKLEREGVTSSQERLLTLLYIKNGATQSELQQDLLIKPSSVTKLVDVLEHKGLVTRMSGDKDARVKRIHLTEKGKFLEEQLWFIKNEMEAQIGKSLSEEQHSSLIHLLNVVKKDLQQS